MSRHWCSFSTVAGAAIPVLVGHSSEDADGVGAVLLLVFGGVALRCLGVKLPLFGVVLQLCDGVSLRLCGVQLQLCWSRLSCRESPVVLAVVVARFSYRAPPISTTLMMVVGPDQVPDDAGYLGVLQSGSSAYAGFGGPVLLPCRLGIGRVGTRCPAPVGYGVPFPLPHDVDPVVVGPVVVSVLLRILASVLRCYWAPSS